MCNTSLYNSFRHHLDCNFIIECQHGEDEHQCPGTTEACQGALQYGRKCYRYLSEKKTLSWNEAAAECTKQGAMLAMLKTFNEMAAVKDAIIKGKRVQDVYVGLRKPEKTRFLHNRELWQWVDGTVSYQFIPIRSQHTACAALDTNGFHIQNLHCNRALTTDFICEFDVDTHTAPRVSLASMTFTRPHYSSNGGCLSLVSCPSEHVTHEFLSCDAGSTCGLDQTGTYCSTLTITVLNFACEETEQFIPYSLVCDFYSDCKGGSDENFCNHEPCSSDVTCGNGQCLLTSEQRCDNKYDCRDRSDEIGCSFSRYCILQASEIESVIYFGSGDTKNEILTLYNQPKCPATHVLCPGSHCLPVFIVCNGIYDCPGWEDEVQCDSYTCPGFYRCRQSAVCLHPVHLCDGVPQCSLQDDELLCNVKCPRGCHCLGLSAVCKQSFPPGLNTQLRYIDASNIMLQTNVFNNNFYLVGLRLVRCGVRQLNLTLPNLKMLDLSDNLLAVFEISWLSGLGNLRELILTRNPLEAVLGQIGGLKFSSSLKIADVSKTQLTDINVFYTSYFPNLTKLNVSESKVKAIPTGFLHNMSLEVLDLRGTFIEEYPVGFLKSLSNLRKVYGEHYKLCCKASIPDHFDTKNCHTPDDPVSSCNNIIASDFYRMLVWFVSVVAFVGNNVNVVYLIKCLRKLIFIRISMCQTLLINLGVCNTCKSIYLLMIVVADVAYRDDIHWTSSSACFLAGVLSVLSDHVTGTVLLTMTLERVKPFRFQSYLGEVGNRKKIAVCGLMWSLGIGVTMMVFLLPGLTGSEDWRFFRRTGLCTPVVISVYHQHHHVSAVSVHFTLQLAMHFLTIVLLAYVKFSTRHIIKSEDLDYLQLEDVVWTDCVGVVVMANVTTSLSLLLPAWLTAVGLTSVHVDVSVAFHLLVKPFNAAFSPLLILYFTAKESAHRQNMRAFLHII